MKVSSVGETDIKGTGTNESGTKSLAVSGLGPVFTGGGKTYNLNYTCSETTLVIKLSIQNNVIQTSTFKREKK